MLLKRAAHTSEKPQFLQRFAKTIPSQLSSASSSSADGNMPPRPPSSLSNAPSLASSASSASPVVSTVSAPSPMTIVADDGESSGDEEVVEAG
jgi:hypothetical protein